MPQYLSPTTMGVAPVVQNQSPGAGWRQGTSTGTTPTWYDTGGGKFAVPLGGVSGGTQTGGPFSAGAPPNLESLTNLVNQLNLTAQQASNAGRIPGNAGLEQQSSNNIGSLLRGEIPADVLRQLTQQSAERGVAMGSPGSDNANSELLRSLGLTSLGLQQQGQQNLSAADARNPGAPIFDPTSQLLTPYQAGQLGLGQGQQNIEWYKALHPNTGGGGGGGYGGGGQPSDGGSVWDPSKLFPPFSGGTPSPSPFVPPSSGGGSTTTSVPGATLDWSSQNFGDLFGSPGDYSQPPNTVNTDTSSFYDPLAGYDPFSGF